MEEIVTEKECLRCREYKTTTLFSRNKAKKDGFQSFCKECQKDFNKKPKNKKYKYESKSRLYKFKVTQEFLDQMLENQDGKCLICKKDLEKFCVDHDHKTNKIRGLLCIRCNVGLGMFKDNTMFLTSAIEYLVKK